jgi:flagellar hook assembly protein FlgD
VAEILAIIPSEFALSKNYPNPFNPITHLDYSLPKRSQVRLRVYNMVGQEIITLINEEKQYGNYSISWNGIDSKGRNVASGVYFAELRSNDKSSVTKMLLLK